MCLLYIVVPTCKSKVLGADLPHQFANNASSTTQNGYPHLVGYLPHHQLPLLGAWANYQSFADVSQNLGVDFDFGAADGLCVFARFESGFCEMAH